jgi:2,4-dienoyl-CoA reductase-like NADH-dependent reductase (Old Yellow Enzyme family)
VQIGNAGYLTYSSLFPEEQDAVSSSWGFDFAFGYNNTRKEMPVSGVRPAIAAFARAAVRVREAGADGLEITATRGTSSTSS